VHSRDGHLPQWPALSGDATARRHTSSLPLIREPAMNIWPDRPPTWQRSAGRQRAVCYSAPKPATVWRHGQR